MPELARRTALRREDLAEGAYLESLLEAALAKALIDRAFVEHVQMGCMELLATQCARYTGGQSTSLPREQAEDILQSIVFTLGVWLKGYPEPQDALTALGQGSQALAEGLQAGLRRVQTKTRATRQFYRLAQRRMVNTDNELYNGTAYGGMAGFFKLYEPRFGAHHIHITADYPLLFYPEGYQGIEFIQLYIQRLDYENRFCRAFPARQIKAALTLHAIEYDTTVEDMHANLCAVILQAALACALCGEPITGLALSPAGRAKLADILKGDAAARLPQALEGIVSEIAISAGAAKYVRQAVKQYAVDMASEMRLMA